MSRKRQRAHIDSEDEHIAPAPPPRTRAATRASTNTATGVATRISSTHLDRSTADVNAQADTIAASVMSQAAAATAAGHSTALSSASGGPPLVATSNGQGSGISRPSNPGPNDASGHAGRRRVPAMYIQDKTRRHITFSKRKAGLLKKANELACLTGTEVLLLIASEAGTIYFHATDKFRPLVDTNEAKQRISDCLLASRRAAAAAAVAAANAAAATQPESSFGSQAGPGHRASVPQALPAPQQRPLVCKFVKMQPTDAEGLDHAPLLVGVASSTSNSNAAQPASMVASTPPVPPQSHARSHGPHSPFHDRAAATGTTHVPGAVGHTPSMFDNLRRLSHHDPHAATLGSSQDVLRESTGPESLVSSPNVPQHNSMAPASIRHPRTQSSLHEFAHPPQATYQQAQHQRHHYTSQHQHYLHHLQEQQQEPPPPSAFVGRSLSAPPPNESPIPRQDSAMFPMGGSNQQLPPVSAPPLPYHQQIYPTNQGESASGIGTRTVGLPPVAPLPTALDLLFSQSQGTQVPTSIPQQPPSSNAFASSALAQHLQYPQQQAQQPVYSHQQAAVGPNANKRQRVSRASTGYDDDPSLRPTLTAANASASTYTMYGQSQHQPHHSAYYHSMDPPSRAGSVSYDPTAASPADLVSTAFSPGQCTTIELGGTEEPHSHRPFGTTASESAPSVAAAATVAAAAAAAAYPMLPPLPNSAAAAAGASPAATNGYLWFSAHGSSNPTSGTSAATTDQSHMAAAQQYQRRAQQSRNEEHGLGQR